MLLPIGVSATIDIAPGNFLIIRVIETKILSFKEPNIDLSAFLLLLLKRIVLFL